MEMKINPFLYPRREYDDVNIIYVSNDSEYLEWTSNQQYLFEGIRGSGKTSILKSMDWEVLWQIGRIKVEGPKAVKDIFDQAPKHLGVCCRMEEMDKEYWDMWKREVGIDWAQKYFGTYLEYLLLDMFLSALLGILRRKPECFENPKSDKQLLKDLIQSAFPSPLQFRPKLSEESLWELRSLIRGQHYGIRDLVFRKYPADVLRESYPVLSPGELLRCFAESLRSNYEVFSELKIFPMLDDCNHLTEWQAQVINSAISRAKTPVSYKITTVFGLYASLNTIDGRPLSEQELKRIAISPEQEGKWEPHDRFVDLIQGVCQTRITQYYEPKYARRFNFKRLLGNFDIEYALEKTLDRSEKSKAIELLAKAREEASIKGKAISITSAWLTEKQVREEAIPSNNNPEIHKKLLRQLNSKYFKKWKYSAAIAICRDPEFRSPFPYYGWSIVVHLCCGSVREFLHIMSEIWSELKLPIDRFVEIESLDLFKQSKAIRTAAKSHFNTLDKKPVLYTKDQEETSLETVARKHPSTSLPSLCERLGKLFEQFQSLPAVLANPETASLKLKKEDIPDYIIRFIDFAVMAGAMLKEEKKGEKTLAVGLHPFFSPLFNISFRYPFYFPQNVSKQDFVSIFSGNNSDARRAMSRIVKDRMINYAKRHKSKKKIQYNDVQMDFLIDIEGEQ